MEIVMIIDREDSIVRIDRIEMEMKEEDLEEGLEVGLAVVVDLEMIEMVKVERVNKKMVIKETDRITIVIMIEMGVREVDIEETEEEISTVIAKMDLINIIKWKE